ncbi:integrase protein [Rhizobium phage RHph_I72]|nr:integrase protein [Rhizobium phage RHph_I65]QIG76464.1 integrase protein [Rhizobium phage RHph_I72]
MIKGDTSAAIQFLQAWSPDDPWQLTAIVPDGRVTTTTFDGEDRVKRARKWIEERNGRENIYFTVNPLIQAKNVKATKTEIRGMRWLHVDLDPRPGEDLDAERERAERLLREFKPAPTVIIDSGGGFQGFWLLDREQTTNGSEEKAAELEAYNLQIEVLLGADSCHNIDRIMRLPGTVNLPNEKKRKKGRIERLAIIVDEDWDRVYRLGQFTPAPRVQSREPTGSGPQVKISGNLPSIMLEDLPPGVSSRTKALIVNGNDVDDPGRYPSRSEVLFAVLCEMIRGGCTDDQIAAVIMDPDYRISDHVLEQPRPQSYVARQIQRAHEEAIDPWLRKLNEAHAVIEDIGGRCRVISEVMDYSLNRTRISRQSFDDFRNRYMHLNTVVGVDKDGNEVKMPVGKWWLLNSARRQYRTIMFAPGKEISDSYNLWTGFACEARPGDCSKLLSHIHDNVCSGNEEYAEYLINWMARCVQHPDSPGMVAVILRGRMGVGKSFVIKAFGSLWGRHFLQVSDPKHLVGSFNAHLRDCVVLFGDEAFYAGDKKHESILKTMVTEETIMIEGKGVDAEIAPNYVHLMMASNGEWVVPAGVDDRRFFVLDVGSSKMQNKEYFADIQKQLDGGGREAFLHYLMTKDISGFEVRHYPKTTALQEQKVLSMSPEEQWWFEKLVDGTLQGDSWAGEVPKAEIQRDYINYATRQKVMRPASPTGLGKFLQRVLPAQYPRAFQKMGEIEYQDRTGMPIYKRAKIWYYEFPSLEQARSFWDERFGGPYAWPKIHENLEEETKDSDTPF